MLGPRDFSPKLRPLIGGVLHTCLSPRSLVHDRCRSYCTNHWQASDVLSPFSGTMTRKFTSRLAQHRRWRAYVAPRVAGFPETPLQAKLPLGARHRGDKRAPPGADRTHIWEELLLPSPAPAPRLCDFLDVVLLRTKHSLDSVWSWQDIQEVQIFQEPSKFCDCHGAWLPGGSSSQCSSPGDLDGWMQNVL